MFFGFDACTGNAPAAVFENARASCAAAGYRLPDLVSRNVDSRSEQQPVTENDRGAALVSGCSPPKALKNQNTGFFAPSASPRFAGPDMLFACLRIDKTPWGVFFCFPLDIAFVLCYSFFRENP